MMSITTTVICPKCRAIITELVMSIPSSHLYKFDLKKNKTRDEGHHDAEAHQWGLPMVIAKCPECDEHLSSVPGDPTRKSVRAAFNAAKKTLVEQL